MYQACQGRIPNWLPVRYPKRGRGLMSWVVCRGLMSWVAHPSLYNAVWHAPHSPHLTTALTEGLAVSTPRPRMLSCVNPCSHGGRQAVP